MGDVRCDFKKLISLQKKVEELAKIDKDLFMEQCAKELAARFLGKVIKRTPVGQYPKSSGKKGGTLRRGWTTQKSGSGSEGLSTSGASQFADTLKVHRYGGVYVIEIENPINYASYVEFGHRKRGGKGWVEGKFMLTISEKEIQTMAPKILEKKLHKFLGEALNGK